MDTFVLRWTKDNVPFWQGVDDGEKIEINAVADVINENAKLKRAAYKVVSWMEESGPGVDELIALLTKETNDD